MLVGNECCSLGAEFKECWGWVGGCGSWICHHCTQNYGLGARCETGPARFLEFFRPGVLTVLLLESICIFAMARVSSGGADTEIPCGWAGAVWLTPGWAVCWMWSWCRSDFHCCSKGPGTGWIGDTGIINSWFTAHNHCRRRLNSIWRSKMAWFVSTLKLATQLLTDDLASVKML